MSLHKLVNKLNLNDEMFVPKIEGCNCEEGEPELVDPSEVNETMTEIESDMDDIAEANEVTDDVEAFLAERVDAIKDDGLKEVPIEEQVAVQEKLREVLRVTGLTLTNSLNKESLGNTEAYYMNLEGLKEVMSSIGEVIRSIWEKIVAAIKKLINQLGSLLPSKINNINKAIKALEEHKSFKMGSNDIPALEYDFRTAYLDRFTAISNLFNQGGKLSYFKAMDKLANEIEGFFRNFNAGKVTSVANGLNFKNSDISKFINPAVVKGLRGKSYLSDQIIVNVKTYYKSIYVKYIMYVTDNDIRFDSEELNNVFKEDKIDFNIPSVIHELTIDKECLSYFKPFMERLRVAADGIAKTSKDNYPSEADLKMFKNTLTRLFKSLFTDYVSIIQTATAYDLAVARILIQYFKKINR